MKSPLLARVKDEALRQGVLLFLEPKLRRYGVIEKFTLDTTAKRLTAEVRLHGDPLPLAISEAYYEIRQEGEESLLVLYGVRTSREWVQNLLEDYLPKLRWKIPSFLRRLI